MFAYICVCVCVCVFVCAPCTRARAHTHRRTHTRMHTGTAGHTIGVALVVLVAGAAGVYAGQETLAEEGVESDRLLRTLL